MRQTDLWRPEKARELSEPKRFRAARQDHHSFCNSARIEIPGPVQLARRCAQSRSRMPGSSWLLCNGGAPPRISGSARPRSSDHRKLRTNCLARHDELSPIASPCRQPRRSTARAVSSVGGTADIKRGPDPIDAIVDRRLVSPLSCTDGQNGRQDVPGAREYPLRGPTAQQRGSHRNRGRKLFRASRKARHTTLSTLSH